MVTTAARQQQRRRTRAQWTSENPILAAGEIGFESDTDSTKIGNGTATWNALPYATDGLATTGALPAGLVRGRRRMPKNEGVQVDPGNSLTLLSATGQGVVNHIWMAVAFNATPEDMVLRVTVDGEGSPAIDVDLGSLLAIEHFKSTARQFSNAHAHVEQNASAQVGFTLTLPIPFSNGCLIEIFNASAALVIIYSMVSWTDAPPGDYRLRSSSVKGLSPTTVLAANTFDYLDLASGAGWLVWHGLAVDATGGSFIERNHLVYIDGEGTASFQSSGTEDWQSGSFTHQGRQNIGTPYKMLGTNVDTPDFQLVVAMDLISLYSGIRFDNGVKFQMSTEAGTTHNSSISHSTLYYLHV
jgi:hypothetical protein